MTGAAWKLDTPDRLLDVREPATFAFVGRRGRLLDADVACCVPEALRPGWTAIVKRLEPNDGVATAKLSLGEDHAIRVLIGVLPDGAARDDAPARPHEVSALLRQLDDDGSPARVLVACDRAGDAIAHTIAATRALPTYTRKTRARRERNVRVAFAAPDADMPASATLEILRDAVARAMLWQDMPCCELGTNAFVDLAIAQGRASGAEVIVLRGEELAEAGLTGIHAVGAAATEEPALVVLRRAPEPSQSAGAPRLAWVGKGVVFDSGGLSLKRPHEMQTMKGDMSGAATVLAAFSAATALDPTAGLDAVLCIAENAIGPRALRPDDILTMHSGKTVEIADTDCEGRLLLADGLSYAAANLKPDVLVDLATLTDSAVVATGHRHAAMFCNEEALERTFIAAGQATGDLVHPLPYLPAELARALASEVADLRNEATTNAAGASCAAHFLAEHLHAYRGKWLHIDMEGPARTPVGRGTGFGVGLLLRSFGFL